MRARVRACVCPRVRVRVYAYARVCALTDRIDNSRLFRGMTSFMVEQWKTRHCFTMGYQKFPYPFGFNFPEDFRYTTIGQGLYHRLSRPPLRSGLDGLMYAY